MEGLDEDWLSMRRSKHRTATDNDDDRYRELILLL